MKTFFAILLMTLIGPREAIPSYGTRVRKAQYLIGKPNRRHKRNGLPEWMVMTRLVLD